MHFETIKQARDYLLANGYKSCGYGAMTKAEGYVKGTSTLFIRRARGISGVVVR
jgi:hypothetical protein